MVRNSYFLFGFAYDCVLILKPVVLDVELYALLNDEIFEESHWIRITTYCSDIGYLVQYFVPFVLSTVKS